jgi:hypothetical protein
MQAAADSYPLCPPSSYRPSHRETSVDARHSADLGLLLSLPPILSPSLDTATCCNRIDWRSLRLPTAQSTDTFASHPSTAGLPSFGLLTLTVLAVWHPRPPRPLLQFANNNTQLCNSPLKASNVSTGLCFTSLRLSTQSELQQTSWSSGSLSCSTHLPFV